MAIQNVLFYSKNVKACHEFIALLKNDGIFDFFRLICIDETPVKNITEVPTILIKDVKKPFIGRHAFEWVKQFRQFKQKNQKNDDPDKYNRQEMSGFSDDFAYLNKDDPFPHCFMKYGMDDKTIIYTAQELKKIDKTNQRNLITKLAMERKKIIGEKELKK